MPHRPSEIRRQIEGRVRTFVAGFGTCGTLTGVGWFPMERDPGVQILADLCLLHHHG